PWAKRVGKEANQNANGGTSALAARRSRRAAPAASRATTTSARSIAAAPARPGNHTASAAGCTSSAAAAAHPPRPTEPAAPPEQAPRGIELDPLLTAQPGHTVRSIAAPFAILPFAIERGIVIAVVADAPIGHRAIRNLPSLPAQRSLAIFS